MPVHDIEAVLKAEEDAISRIRTAEAEAESAIKDAEREATVFILEERKKADSAAEEEISGITERAWMKAEQMAADTSRRVEKIEHAAESKRKDAVHMIVQVITGGEDVLSGRDA